MYSPTLAARLVGLTPQRTRRWLRGYAYRYTAPVTGATERRLSPAVVARRGADASPYASFLDVIDLLFVKRFLEHGISLQKLRQALEEVEKILGGHHFAQRGFWTDGRNIFLDLKKSEGEATALLQLLSGGQWVIAPIIKHTAKQIQFHRESGFALRWFPLGSDKPVVIDPRVMFGAPSIVGRAVETANVFDLYRAEGRNASRVCPWMNLTIREEVNAAVEMEEYLQAA